MHSYNDYFDQFRKPEGERFIVDKQIMLSIYITTYNHKKYIRKALDSVLSQKTQYSYEVLIGDDASSDGTRYILKEYEKLHPKVFKVLYREENMGAKGANNMLDLINRCIGKYIIALEGDDFWIDTYKVEKQIKFLEKHHEYIGVAHNCLVVNDNSEPNSEIYPECKENIYTIKHLASNILPGQLTTVMYRNIYKNNDIDTSILREGLIPADRLIYFILISYGNLYCVQEKMSAYRHITTGGSSFSANFISNYKEAKDWNMALVRYSRSINNPESIKYADLMLMKVIIGSRKRYAKGWKEIIIGLREVKFPVKRYVEYFFQLVRRIVLHKNVWA